jgi:hypothetical protein
VIARRGRGGEARAAPDDRTGAGGPGDTPLTLVSGFVEAPKRRAVQRWLAERPDGERWALLVDGAFDATHRLPDGVTVFETAAGCACCLGALALRTTLARVLRQGPWDRLLLLLSPSARPAAIVDGLRAGIAGAALRIDAVIAIVDAQRAGPWLDPSAPGASLAREQVDAAALVVLVRGPGAVSPRLASVLADGPLGARALLQAGESTPSWREVTAALPARSAYGLRRWPGEVAFDRARLQRALAALRAREPDLPMRGVFRTARDWYLWQPGLAEPWQATCWRLDSRLMCALTDAESSTWLDSALEQAILADRPDER